MAIKKIHEDKQSGTAVTALLREAAVMTSVMIPLTYYHIQCIYMYMLYSGTCMYNVKIIYML